MGEVIVNSVSTKKGKEGWTGRQHFTSKGPVAGQKLSWLVTAMPEKTEQTEKHAQLKELWGFCL